MLAGNNSHSALLEPFVEASLEYGEVDYVTVSIREGKWERLCQVLLAELMTRRANRRGPGRPAKGIGSGSFESTEDAVEQVREAYSGTTTAKHKDVAEALHISVTLLWRIRKLAEL